jgi:hypothetical protein
MFEIVMFVELVESGTYGPWTTPLTGFQYTCAPLSKPDPRIVTGVLPFDPMTGLGATPTIAGGLPLAELTLTMAVSMGDALFASSYTCWLASPTMATVWSAVFAAAKNPFNFVAQSHTLPST